MTPEIWVALIGTIPSLATFLGIVYSIRVSQGNRKVVDRTEAKMDTVEKHTNGLLAKAQTATETAVAVGEARAEGLQAGAQQERDRNGDPKG